MAATSAAELERLAPALEGTTPSRRMLVVVNPYATTVSDRLRHLVVYALQGRYSVEAVDTRRRGHATELAREAARDGADVVVAFGGDGTVNEAANGLAGTGVPLSCLPGGSANVFCRMLGIPTDVVDATEHLLGLADGWHPRAVDLGVVNGRRFCFASGVGLDASVVERVDANPRAKARWREYYFATTAVGTFMRHYAWGAPRLEVEIDGRRLEGVTAVVQNAAPFTYFKGRPIDLAPDAALDSGTLAAGVLRRATALDVPTVGFRALSKRAEVAHHRQVDTFATPHEFTVRPTGEDPLPIQVDGDYIGHVGEAVYRVEPGALRVIS